jgi:brefeldin A-inhibited guanine nucleotide-exchange protein
MATPAGSTRSTATDATGGAASVAKPSDFAKAEISHAIVKCAVHLYLIQEMHSAFTNGLQARSLFEVCPWPSLLRLLAGVRRSHAFAKEFNADYDLRLGLWKAGLVQQMPNLVKQETTALSTRLVMLFALYRLRCDLSAVAASPSADGEGAEPIHEELSKLATGILDRYLQMVSDASKHQRDINAWSPLVIEVYKGLLSMPWENVGTVELKKYIPTFFRVAIKLIVADRADVRAILQEFLEHIADRFLSF